jgi:hypothetical protein
MKMNVFDRILPLTTLDIVTNRSQGEGDYRISFEAVHCQVAGLTYIEGGQCAE